MICSILNNAKICKNHLPYFSEKNIEMHTIAYSEIENKPNINVVLASATSFNTLREAYPNYFADIKEFIKLMKNIVRKYKN